MTMTDLEVSNSTTSRITDEENVEEEESLFSFFSAFDLSDAVADSETEGTELTTTASAALQDQDKEDLTLQVAMQRLGFPLQLLESHRSFSDVDVEVMGDQSLICIPTANNTNAVKLQEDQTTTIAISPKSATSEKKDRTHDRFRIKNELKHRYNLVITYMGSMSLCRGRNGDTLRKAGAIDALLSLLYSIRSILLSYSPIKDSITDILIKNRNDILYELSLDVVSSSLGALRDLACGNVFNRNAVGSFFLSPSIHNDDDSISRNICDLSIPYTTTEPTIVTPTATTTRSDGIDILLWYIHRYTSQSTDAHHKISATTTTTKLHSSLDTMIQRQSLQDHDERAKKELRLFTNALGVLRNISHSNRTNCLFLHEGGVTYMFRIWLLQRCTGGTAPLSCYPQGQRRREPQSSMPQSYQRLPDAGKPWREACYRMAGCLINMAEKCVECAIECSSSLLTTMDDGGLCGSGIDGGDELIWILMESWAGVGVYHQSCKEEDSSLGDSGAIPVLHLGLAAILKQCIVMIRRGVNGHEKKVPTQACGGDDTTAEGNRSKYFESSAIHPSRSQQKQYLEKTIEYILNREEERKRRAQERERIRKLCQETKPVR